MKVMFINNDGGGFADFTEVEEGTTVAKLFEMKLPEQKPASFLIRVNRQAATADQLLVDGDRISITPNKISGATS